MSRVLEILKFGFLKNLGLPENKKGRSSLRPFHSLAMGKNVRR